MSAMSREALFAIDSQAPTSKDSLLSRQKASSGIQVVQSCVAYGL